MLISVKKMFVSCLVLLDSCELFIMLLLTSNNHVSQVLMDYLLCTQIYEIGGGSGTCAKGIMNYLKLNAPTRVYNNMSYTYDS